MPRFASYWLRRCDLVYTTGGVTCYMHMSPHLLGIPHLHVNRPLRGISSMSSCPLVQIKTFQNTCIQKVLLLSKLFYIKFVTRLEFLVQTILFDCTINVQCRTLGLIPPIVQCQYSSRPLNRSIQGSFIRVSLDLNAIRYNKYSPVPLEQLPQPCYSNIWCDQL